MTEDELNELEYLRTWEGDLSEEQFDRLYQLENMSAKPVNATQELESMRSDVQVPFKAEERSPDATPFAIRTPRTSEIVAESRINGKEGPIVRQRRIDEANQAMLDEIKAIKNRASSYEGTEFMRNPIGNTMLGLIAPATAEAYRSDRMPDLVDAGIDVGLAASTLYATPAKAAPIIGKVAPRAAATIAPKAGIVGNIAREGITSGAIGALGEGALSAKNDRSYDLIAPVVSAGVGSALGGFGDYAKVSQLRKMGFSDEEIPDLLGNIRSGKTSTVKNITKDVPTDIRSLGTKTIEEPMSIAGFDAGDATSTEYIEAPPDIMNTIEDRFNYYMRDKRLNGELTMPEYKVKKKAFDDFKGSILNIGEFDKQNQQQVIDMLRESRKRLPKREQKKLLKTTISKPVPHINYPSILSELRYIDDPDVGTAITDVLDETLPSDIPISDVFNALHKASRYKSGVSKLPDLVEGGTIASIAKNAFTGTSPHGVEAARVLTAPAVASSPLRVTKKDVEQPKKPTMTNNPLYDENNDLLYAPRGYITYEDLWAEAPKKK